MKKKNIFIAVISGIIVIAAIVTTIFIVKHNKNTFTNDRGDKQKYLIDKSGQPLTNAEGKYAVTITDKNGKTPTYPDKTPATEYVEGAAASLGGNIFETIDIKIELPKGFKNSRAAGQENGNDFKSDKYSVVIRSYKNSTMDDAVNLYLKSAKNNPVEEESSVKTDKKIRTFDSNFSEESFTDKKGADKTNPAYQMKVYFFEHKGNAYSIIFVTDKIDKDYTDDIVSKIQFK